MKYLSLILLFVTMQLTWALIEKEPIVQESVHIGIQEDLKRFIQGYIEENLPSATNIRFKKFWTETLKNKQVKAHFVYSFEDAHKGEEAAEIEISGFALLNKTDEESLDEEFWSFDELTISDNKMTFKEGIRLSAGDEPLEGQPQDDKSTKELNDEGTPETAPAQTQ